MLLRRLALVLMLSLGAAADLNRAQELIEQHRGGDGWREALRCRSEDPERSELLEIWGRSLDLQEEQAYARLDKFRPRRQARLYLIVRSQLLSNQQRDLLQALELCATPEQKVDVLLRLYRATRYPEDEKYWLEAAEIAAQRKLPDELLARLSLCHLTLLCSAKRPQEAWNDLAQAGRLLKDQPAQLWLARYEILEALGRSPEAREARWKAAETATDPTWRMRLFKQISDYRNEMTPEAGRRLLRNLEGDHSLFAFRLRSVVCQETSLGLTQWLAEAERLSHSRQPSVRLLALSERAYVRLRLYQGPAAGKDLKQALQLSLIHPPHPRSALFANARAGPLAMTLATLERAQGRFQEAEGHARQSLEADQTADAFFVRQMSHQTLLGLYLQTGRMDAARKMVEEIFAEAEKSEIPAVRASSYGQVFNSLLGADLHPTRLFQFSTNFTPIRMDPDTPSGWLFEEIRQDEALQARIFAGLDSWRDRANSPLSKGSASLFRGMFLACLDRPLEAIDSYTEGIRLAEGVPSIQANLGLLLSQELLGQNRRAEALEVIRRSYAHVQKVGMIAMPGRYRLALIGLLLHQGLEQEADNLLNQALKEKDDGDRAMLLLLRGRVHHRLEDLQEALKTKDETLRAEIYYQLDQWEPAAGWLEHIQGRDLKTWLRLARAYEAKKEPAQVLRVGQLGLEQFGETFQQLPASARQRAVRSPSLLNLLDVTVQASIQLGQQSVGTGWLARWRAWQELPVADSPELEQLRAELTGLRNDPQLQARLADTRAQFLLKLNELRARNPEMETALSAQSSELLALQPHLDGQTLLVQYYLAPDGLYLQSLTHDKQILQSIRVEKTRLLQLLDRWNSSLVKPGTLDLEASRQLYSLLVAPLRELRQQHPNLWIMPSGELWSLPWETLQDEQGHYLVESSACSYLGPSEALQLTAPAARSGSGRWIGFGNSQLEGTQRELDGLKALFPDGVSLNGPEANWANLQRLAPEARFLHLATHSQALPLRPTESYLELADGKVPLGKVYGLELPPGSLVVLSSCSGAVGQEHRQRDLISLSSGFRSAGASAVVAALWPVDDLATARFFGPLYQEILAGGSRQAGLQKAKRAMLTTPEFAHPFYWGAFTLLGDPR